MKIGYARVSTEDQRLDAQLDKLQAAGCDRIFSDKASGAKAARAGLADALSHLRPGDSLVICKLDRLGRTVKQLLDLAEELREKGINLQILDLGIDTSTPAGKLAFTLLAAFAELERDLIRERTRHGLEAAKARGRMGGRKAKLAPAEAKRMRELAEAGALTHVELMRQYGVSKPTFYRYLRA
jgi:DNA invertase Pin-like site-specific DNA recombinase